MRILRRFLRFWQIVWSDFCLHRSGLVAAAVAYYALVSSLPLTMVIIAGLGHVLGSNEAAEREAERYLRELIPRGSNVLTHALREVIRTKDVMGGLGLLILLWTGSQLFVTLQHALDVAWEVPRTRNWAAARAVSLASTLTVGLLALLSIGLAAGASAVRAMEMGAFGRHINDVPWFWHGMARLSSFVFTLLMFVLLYRFLPSRKVSWRESLLGGVLATVLWEVAKLAFAWYVSRIPPMSRFFGSLGGLILVALWGFYSALVLLFGAEAASTFGDVYKRHVKSLDPPTPPTRNRSS